jgi:hypothetical protein
VTSDVVASPPRSGVSTEPWAKVASIAATSAEALPD